VIEWTVYLVCQVYNLKVCVQVFSQHISDHNHLLSLHYTVRVRQWAAATPIRVRYLIVAAFLAGSNPKESDNLKVCAFSLLRVA